jgi:chemotaxis protein histidine kinase CheA
MPDDRGLEASDAYAERIAAVRRRFVAKLDGRIDVIASAAPPSGRDLLELAHREAHGLCGIGQTLGFVETGKVARSIERLLLAAVKDQRAINDAESVHLREGIALLRTTATAEMALVGQG